MNAEELKDQIKKEADNALQKIKSIETFSKEEVHQTHVAAEILLALVKGNEVSEAQIKFLKEQSIDLGKALAIIGLQAVPGSSVAIILLEKVARKHGFTLFPQIRKEP